MKKNLVIGCLLLLVFVGPRNWLQGQVCLTNNNGHYTNLVGAECINAIATAAAFLRIAPDARSGAMGDVGLATSADANSIHFNASKLVFAEKNMGVSISYAPWLRSVGSNGSYLTDLSVYKKLDNDQVLSGSFRFFSSGNNFFADAQGDGMYEGNFQEFAIALAYARRIGTHFSAAVTGKLIHSNLLTTPQLNTGIRYDAQIAGAADISLTYDKEIDLGATNSDLTIGLAISNLGSKMKYSYSPLDQDFLPANIGLGAAWTLHLGEYHALTFAADLNKLLVPAPCLGGEDACDLNNNQIADYKEQSSPAAAFHSFSDAPNGISEEIRELMLGFGMEYWYKERLAIRAGHFTEHATKGGRRFFTLGAGLKYDAVGVNFSYLLPSSNRNDALDQTLRFSLLFDFGIVGN